MRTYVHVFFRLRMAAKPEEQLALSSNTSFIKPFHPISADNLFDTGIIYITLNGFPLSL